MGLPLLLPLLLLPAPLQAGSSAGSNSMHSPWVQQPEHLSASEGGSIHIPFSFHHPWELAEVPDVRIFWRWKQFHGAFIYNTTPPFIHEDFKKRLVLHWAEGCSNGSLQILNLRSEDHSTYFGRVQLNTRNHGKQMWQSIRGTSLKVTAASETTTLGPATCADSTTRGLGAGNGSARPQPLSLEAMVGVALASAVLITVILGLSVYFWWKKNKGLRAGVRTPARGSFQNSEEEQNTGHKDDLTTGAPVHFSTSAGMPLTWHNDFSLGQRTDPRLDPKDDGILYASLTISSSTSPATPPNGSPQEVTLYSTLKA
ncbi:paired immunoglobulin-like type 2 receptor alpha isoform X2 [Talpa occidentalis]|uniref:paired immunoglobulin-like type 2 receptor alpha isoform X2 n=1 Tax=Talpa occidentalis TaxID=50954 RepID=UPI00188E6008|nr:paired immunoglobulin-like type 2 receptor alpha isoform X2 [Talpa occidentalis]